LLIGAASLFASRHLTSPLPEAIGGDAFFLSFLLMSWWLVFRLKASDLRRRADIEDEGGIVVSLITIGAIGYASLAVFETLHGKSLNSPLTVLLARPPAPEIGRAHV